jgi:hypothetical protein
MNVFLTKNMNFLVFSVITILYKCQASQLLAVDLCAFLKNGKYSFLAIQNPRVHVIELEVGYNLSFTFLVLH